MAKAEPVEIQLDRLASLRKEPDPAKVHAEVAKAIASRTNLISAKGADLARELQIKDFGEAMHEAFDRFMQKGGSSDKGCAAKTAIARALYELGMDDQALFLRGIHHVQMEPVWGGSADSAAELRGVCALGLVRSGYRDVMNELAELLVDADPQARLSAARAVGYSENDLAGVPLLRLKLTLGDAQPEVLAECFASLFKLAPAKSIDFAAKLLDRDDEDMRQMAMLALGESRQPAAYQLLEKRYDREITSDRRRPLLLAMAMTRLPESQTYLLRVITDEHRDLASAAIEAMKLYRNDEN
ncbi:MAG TPA: HEAT repeat domain-containing protein, partial [Tepidisphaeraceae bacterium]|nr:HEAT repeat domain-containing protein [Tepidisphaeraceae bacterium]